MTTGSAASIRTRRISFPSSRSTPKISGRFIPSSKYPDDQWKAFLDDREGAIAGREDRETFWMESRRPHSAQGSDLRRRRGNSTFDGIYTQRARRRRFDPILDSLQISRRTSHFGKGQIGWYTVKLDSADDAPRGIKQLMIIFANSPV